MIAMENRSMVVGDEWEWGRGVGVTIKGEHKRIPDDGTVLYLIVVVVL